jgi:hypothetical protein
MLPVFSGFPFLIVPSVFSNVYCFCVFINNWTPPSPSRAFLFVTRYEQCRYVVRSIGIVTNTHFIRWRKPEYPNKTTFYNKWQIWLSSFRYNLFCWVGVKQQSLTQFNEIYFFVSYLISIRYSTIETKEVARFGYNGFLFPHEYSGEGTTPPTIR